MTDKLKVYAAFRSTPDFSGPPPTLHSLHTTLDKAKEALYGDKYKDKWRHTQMFHEQWIGPDGFGLIRLMEVN